MPRVYTRKFDWDAARARYAAGEPLTAIARDMGVHRNAVSRVVRPGEIERQAAYHRDYQKRGRCDDCGGPMNRVSRVRGSRRCVRCSAIARGTTARDGELRCVTCHEWKADEAFPSDKRRVARRGRHRQCTACGTKARQAYRERHKLPCVDCGEPALPPSEKRTTGADVPRCRRCFHQWSAEWQRQPEQREAARQRALARTRA